MNTMIKSLQKPKLTIKAQALATIVAIISAVALPQIFHAMGAISGVGTALGETFLPMHLPIILVGLLAGPYAGFISGLIAPLMSFSLTGMPMIAMLPFMMIELSMYGLFSGLLKNAKMPCAVKVLLAQVLGRGVRAVAITLAIYAFGYDKINISIIWMSISAGIFGIVLQLVLIPLIINAVRNKSINE